MLRSVYNWTIHQAESPYALWALALVAFAESSFFPIPPDVLMIPMILAAPNRAFLIAGVALAASVMGGMAGYAIGAFAYESFGQPLLAAFGKEAYFDQFSERYNTWGVWVVLTAGITPFPYKVITILSGATNLPFGIFMVSSIIARGLRFFVVAGLLWQFGAPIRTFIERYLGWLFTIFIVLLFGSFLLVKYL